MHLNAGNKQLQSLCIKTTSSPGYEEQIPNTLGSGRTLSELLHAHGTLQNPRRALKLIKTTVTRRLQKFSNVISNLR